MTTYYVGTSSAGLADGSSWANRYGTLNDAEDTPVVAGDTVYVGPGTYREMLTCDVSGGAGNPITYIGDYSGDNTDGVGGVVRITGSDDDITATRTNCIRFNSKDNRTFQGFKVDLATDEAMYVLDSDNFIIDSCYIGPQTNFGGLWIGSTVGTNGTVKNCYFNNEDYSWAITVNNAGLQDDVGLLIENCISTSNYGFVQDNGVGGITVKNCTILGGGRGIYVATALTAGQEIVVNNCIINGCNVATEAQNLGEIVENYCSFSGNNTDRTTVNVGASSNAYPTILDSRWFFETVR